METIKLKRLWNNLASFRDYNVKEWMRKKETIKVVTPDRVGEEMTIKPEEWDEAFSAHGTVIKSKFGRDYRLIDLKWRNDKETK